MLRNHLQNEEPNIVYKKMTHSNPRNLKQSQNLRYNIRKKNYLPYEAICYLHVLNDEFHMAHEITTHPELRVVIYDTELISLINLLFDINPNKIDFMFQYDTTFNLCEYFVSPLIVRLHMFEGSPAIPIAFYIHEYKTQETHEVFFRNIARIMPKLSQKTFWVTDKEQAIRNAIKKEIKPKYLLRCWNHLASNITDFVKNHKGKFLDQQFYYRQVTEILRSDTRIEADAKAEQLICHWDIVFTEYYNQHILPDLDNLGKWTLTELNCYNPLSGITTNAAEGK